MNETQEMLPVAAALRTWLGPGRMGRPIAPSTAWRWHKSGARTADGGRAHLRVLRVGGRIYIAREDLRAFIQACSGGPPEASAPTPAPAVPPTLPVAGQAAAVEVLARAGIIAPEAQARLDRPADKPRRGRRGCRK